MRFVKYVPSHNLEQRFDFVTSFVPLITDSDGSQESDDENSSQESDDENSSQESDSEGSLDVDDCEGLVEEDENAEENSDSSDDDIR
jgi:hypothetical protein